MTDQTPALRPAIREIRVVEDVIPILDTARFEHIQRISNAIAQSSLIPETLRGVKKDNRFEPFDHQVVVANVFRIVNQAVRWSMDPFAVLDHCSVVHGRLMYEGKLVHAVVEARLGIRLRYVFGRMVEVQQDGGPKVLKFDPSAEGAGVQLAVQVIGQFGDEAEPRTIEGVVEVWKTSGNNSPWGNPANFKRQLRYRGAREWARAHAPGVMLGVVTDDEIDEDLERHVTVTQTRRGPRQPTDIKARLEGRRAEEGFSTDHVERETAQTEDGTEHDAVTGEVIEGEARLTETASAQSAEAEQATPGSASDASTDSREPTDSGQKGSDETLNASGQDGVDDEDESLDELRRIAYEDGYRGEPVQAVLTECDTDEERKIAAEEHERGHQDRIAKEAEEHAKSDHKADAEHPEPEDVAGPAPKGVTYLLGSDEPNDKGKLQTYKDGEKFSTVGPKGASALKRYDGHPEPADPALKSQSGGTGEVKPSKGALYEELAKMDSWLAQKPRLAALYGSDDFKALTHDDQGATRAHLFGAVLEMKERTKDPVDWAADPSAFTLWADHTARGSDPDAADMIDGTYQTLQASAAYGRMKDEQKATLDARVAALVKTLREVG